MDNIKRGVKRLSVVTNTAGRQTSTSRINGHSESPTSAHGRASSVGRSIFGAIASPIESLGGRKAGSTKSPQTPRSGEDREAWRIGLSIEAAALEVDYSKYFKYKTRDNELYDEHRLEAMDERWEALWDEINKVQPEDVHQDTFHRLMEIHQSGHHNAIVDQLATMNSYFATVEMIPDGEARRIEIGPVKRNSATASLDKLCQDLVERCRRWFRIYERMLHDEENKEKLLAAVESDRSHLLRLANALALTVAREGENGYIDSIKFVGKVTMSLQIPGVKTDTQSDDQLRIWTEPPLDTQAYLEMLTTIRKTMADLKVVELLCRALDDPLAFVLIRSRAEASYERLRWSPAVQKYRSWALEGSLAEEEQQLTEFVQVVEFEAKQLLQRLEQETAKAHQREAIVENLVGLIAVQYRLQEEGAESGRPLGSGLANGVAQRLLQDMAGRIRRYDLMPVHAVPFLV